MDMKELRKNAEKVIAERFPDFNFSTLDWGELDPFLPDAPDRMDQAFHTGLGRA